MGSSGAAPRAAFDGRLRACRIGDLRLLRCRAGRGDGEGVDTIATAPVLAARRARTDMVRRLVAGGGRFSTALGVDVEAGEAEVDRWFMAATLFGARIPTAIAERTFHVLDEAGVTVATARAFGWDYLVALLDRGGYARYDYKTATRLHALCDVLGEHYGGRVCAIPDNAHTGRARGGTRRATRLGAGHRRHLPARATRRVDPGDARTRPPDGDLCPPPRPHRRTCP